MKIEQVNSTIPATEYLWKYLDIHKFLYLIREQKIFFTRFDKFEDPHEGLPYGLIMNKFQSDQVIPEDRLNNKIFLNEKEKRQYLSNAEKIRSKKKQEILGFQQKNFASCWFMDDERESVAMWKLYSNPDSVCIVLKLADLENQLRAYATKVNIHLSGTFYYGPVWYGKIYPPDLINPNIPPQIPDGFMKDECFSHEKEYRFLINSKKPENQVSFYEFPVIEIENLIVNIKAHPNMEEWKTDNIRDLLQLNLMQKFNPSTIKLNLGTPL